jgi:hypothetical protein
VNAVMSPRVLGPRSQLYAYVILQCCYNVLPQHLSRTSSPGSKTFGLSSSTPRSVVRDKQYSERLNNSRCT